MLEHILKLGLVDPARRELRRDQTACTLAPDLILLRPVELPPRFRMPNRVLCILIGIRLGNGRYRRLDAVQQRSPLCPPGASLVLIRGNALGYLESVFVSQLLQDRDLDPLRPPDRAGNDDADDDTDDVHAS